MGKNKFSSVQIKLAVIFLSNKKKKSEMNREQIADALRQNQVVAYPTEAVFGLGCNPQSESAVKKIT